MDSSFFYFAYKHQNLCPSSPICKNIAIFKILVHVCLIAIFPLVVPRNVI